MQITLAADDVRQTTDFYRDAFGMREQVIRRTADEEFSAGCSELVAPHSPEGMPRCSAVGDPSGNWVWLYQG